MDVHNKESIVKERAWNFKDCVTKEQAETIIKEAEVGFCPLIKAPCRKDCVNYNPHEIRETEHYSVLEKDKRISYRILNWFCTNPQVFFQ